MKIHILQRNEKYIGEVEVSDDATLTDLKNEFYKKFHYYPERQRFTTDKQNILNDGRLADYFVVDGSNIYFKDLGVQISWRLVFVLEYLGPLIIMPLFWFFPSWFYAINESIPMNRSLTQMVGLILFLLHFIKREIETLFVHRFSNATMPFIRLPINCAHYWLLCGVSISYFLCHPKYKPPLNGSHMWLYIFASLFLICEALNFQTHYILRQLRPRGTKERGLPKGCGFQWVSCANYMWEIGCWVSFSLLTLCLTSFVFLMIATIQMTIWALKKHALYSKEFSKKHM